MKFFKLALYLLCVMCIQTLSSSALAVDSTATEHAQKGWALYERGEYSRAIVEYKKAIEIDNNYADAHYVLGYIYHLEAAQKNEIAVRALNEDHPTQSYKTKWEHGTKELHLAMDEFKEVLRLEPDAPDAYFKLGVVYDNLGEYEKAITKYNKTIELDPKGLDGLDARGNLALVYYAVYDKKDEAIRVLEELLKIAPNHPARRNLEMIRQGTR